MMVYAVFSLLLGWAVVGNALYFYLKNQEDYPEVRYGHIMGLPWTLGAYREAKGAYWVEEGLAAARQGKWGDAFSLLRRGLPFAPENQEARLTVARIYLMLDRPDLAKPILLEGLNYNPNQQQYLRDVLGFLFGQQADGAVAELADALLARPDLDPTIGRMLGVARVYAYFNRDQFEAAQQAIKKSALTGAPEAEFIEARIAWETGLRESALVQLRALHRRAPQDAEIYRTLLFYLRESKRLDEARRVAVGRQLAFPADPEAFVDYIALCAEDGMTERRGEAEVEFFQRFSGNSQALLKLAQLAAQRGWVEQAGRVVTLCEGKPRELCAATLLEIEAKLTAKAYVAAASQARDAAAAKWPWYPHERGLLAGLEGVALYGQGMDAEGLGTLNRLLASTTAQAQGLAVVGKRLQAMGKAEVAGRVLLRAVELDPLYQPALVELLRLELANQNLDQALAHIERLPLMRKPPGDLMREIIASLESDRYLFITGRKTAITALTNRLSLTQGSTTPSPAPAS